MELKAGIKIHGYTLVEHINNGATAEVWSIVDEFGNQKALKIFSPFQNVDSATLDNLIDEFKLLYKFDHPYILKSEIMGAYQKVPYIIMPYYSSNLAAEMNRRTYQLASSRHNFSNLFSEEECIVLMEQMGSALAYLHDHRIIHQDVKPENILFNDDSGQIHYVLTDFGISTTIKENIAKRTLPRNQAYALTPAYAAPEQFRGRPEYKSDVFSFGVLLFEMCEGSLPFSRQGYISNQYGDVIKPQFRNRDFSPAFKNFVLAALSEDPTERPDAKEFAEFSQKLESFKIMKRGEDDVRAEKITMYHPSTKISDTVSKHVAEDSNTPYPSATIVDRYPLSSDSELKDYNDEDRRNKSDIKRRPNRGWIRLFVVGGAIMILSLGGYALNNNSRVKEMALKATSLFDSGKIQEASILYEKLGRKSEEAEYSDREFVTKTILKENYEVIRAFKAERAAVKKDNMWGYINTEGKDIIPCKYSWVEDFRQNAAAVKDQTGKWGIIDKNGETIHPFIYDGLQVEENEKWVMVRYDNGKKITEEFEN